MLSMMTPVRSFSRTICPAASIPLRRGIPISMITTLGCNSLASRTASRPSAASPTTCMSEMRSSRSFNPVRTIPVSSAIRMLITRDLRHGRLRQAKFDTRSAAGERHHSYTSTQFLHSLFHADHTQASPLHDTFIETPPVVRDCANHPSVPAIQIDLYIVRSRVTRRVGQRLLDDAIHAGPVGVGQRIHRRIDIGVNFHTAGT